MSLLSLTKRLSRKGASAPSPAAQSSPAASKTPVALGTGAHALTLLLEPILTEKSVALQEQRVATFRVPQGVNKHQVALAVEQRYGVRVQRVRLIRVLPRRRRRGATTGLTAAWKKAYVVVDDVQKIVTGP